MNALERQAMRLCQVWAGRLVLTLCEDGRHRFHIRKIVRGGIRWDCACGKQVVVPWQSPPPDWMEEAKHSITHNEVCPW